MKKLLLILLLSLFVSACSTSTTQMPWYRDMPVLKVQYAAAVADGIPNFTRT